MTATDHLLAAIGFARRIESPLLGALLGARRVSDDGLTIGLAFVRDAVPGPTELGVLTDLALGSPVRRRYGLDYRLVTAALDVALAAPCPPASQLVMIADAEPTGESRTGSHLSAGQVADAREPAPPLGICGAAFHSRGAGHAPLPWETGEQPLESDRLDESELSPDDRRLVDLLATTPLAPGTALLDAATTTVDGELVLAPLPVMANRAGVVQGGVIFGFAVTAGLPAHDPTSEFAAHVEFVGPGRIDRPIRAGVTELRAGRRQRLSRVDLTQDGALVATATVRCPAGP